jgi:MYXO-CTERM domain-containing protein
MASLSRPLAALCALWLLLPEVAAGQPRTMTREEIMDLAAYGEGYSYWWGHGCWRTDGAQHGSCDGRGDGDGCPSCDHYGSYGGDCSGYVSKAWQVPRSTALDSSCWSPYYTRNYYCEETHWNRIARESVLLADALVYRNGCPGSSGHILLYERGDPWGMPWIREARGCDYGIVHRTRSVDSSYRTIRRVNLGGACVPADETCNGRDDDCDGAVDDGLSRTCGTDVGECRTGSETCSGGGWGACVGGIPPRAEACDDRDDDCDGATDEELWRACGSDVGECRTGIATCTAGAWGSCVGELPPAAETCDELDNDCDAATDEDRVCEVEEVTFQSPLYDWGGTSDIDGDGRADLCARTPDGFACLRSSGRGFDRLLRGPPLEPVDDWNDPSHYATLRTGDIDGDGRADVCARHGDGVRCWRSSGTAFGAQVDGPPLSDAAGWDRPASYATIRLADFNGDGKADLCARAAAGFQCWPSDGRGFGAAIALDELADDHGWEEVQYYGSLRMGDIDADGRADLCARGADGVSCWLSDGVRFGPRLVGPAWSDADGWDDVSRWSTIRLADVDGDGRADLCGRSGTDFRCHRSLGNGFGPAVPGPSLADADGWNVPERFSTLRMADIDGDGTVDVCARGAGGVECWLWTGAGFQRRIAGPALRDADGWTDRRRYRTLRLADADGDGRADLCARGPLGVSCWLGDGDGFPTVVAGPPWSDDDGWLAPELYATIRFGGPDPHAAAGSPPGGGGCGCTVGGAPAPTGLLLALGLAALARARRRRTGGRSRPGDAASDGRGPP